MTDHDPSFDDTHPLGRIPQPESAPPAYDPYGNPYQDPYAGPYQQATPHPAPAVAHRSGWSWRSSLAGAVAGGVIAASVAVPVSWALANGGAATTTADAPAAAPQQPQQQPQSGGTGEVPGFGQDGSGTDPFGQGTPDDQSGSTSNQTGDQTDATADQSQGVVLINTETTAGEAAGSGLVLDSSGIVLTNYHVVEGSTSVKVTIATTGATYDATVVGHDQDADVALLQLDGASGLATVNLDDDDGDPAVSDAVTAVGNAQGQGYLSASTGSVVDLGQSIDTQSEGTVEGEHLTGLIETNAYVVGGYSGGALLDAEGEVVGITTAASSGGVAQSYAVPIEDALQVAQQIEDGDESDGVQVGASAYLGIAISQTADTSTGSVQVGQVQADGAAADAGIEAGATITGIDGTSITSYDVLRSTMATYQPGDSVTLRWTDTAGAAHSAQVTLGESPVN